MNIIYKSCMHNAKKYFTGRSIKQSLFLLIVLFSGFYCFAEEGIESSIQATINADGTISYYYIVEEEVPIQDKTRRDNQNKRLNEKQDTPSFNFDNQKSELGLKGFPNADSYIPEGQLEEALRDGTVEFYIEDQYGSFPESQNNKKIIPIDSKEVNAKLGKQMLEKATEVSCNSNKKPKEVVVTVSIAVSAGIGIIGGESSVTFGTTWETADICT